MALKYIIEYTNSVGLAFKVNISDINYNGDSSYIRGSASLEYNGVSRVLDPIRGAALVLEIEADQKVDITDLYTENETDITVDFFIDNRIKFKGFVKPDGIYTDFVNELYVITLDCVDGLGTLKNLSFVTPEGLFFVGYMKEIDIIYNCLLRTSINMPINVDINIFHDGIQIELEENTDVLASTKLSADRFYKDDKKFDIMDCEEVLKSVLDKYCAIIHQENGEWFIYRPQDLAKTKKAHFYQYVNGVFNIRKFENNFSFYLGSQINGYYPHHASANQRININGSVSAFRVNYKYGVQKNFFKNSALLYSNGSIENWIVPPTHKFTILDQELGGIRWDGVGITFTNAYELLSYPITVSEGDKLKLALSYFSTGFHNNLSLYLSVSDGVSQHFFNGDNWVLVPSGGQAVGWEIDNFKYESKSCVTDIATDPKYQFDLWKLGNGSLVVEIDIPVVPVDGQVFLTVRKPIVHVTPLTCQIIPESYSFIKSIELIGALDGLKKGEFHTVQRLPKSSSIVENNATVFNGDIDSDVYEGTIKTLSNTNTFAWRHGGNDIEAKKILQIMAEDTLITRSKPQKVFEGDIFGLMPFLSVIQINNVQGDFLPLAYRYDTLQNIVSLKSVEVFTEIEDGSSISYEETIEYNNVVKPTIK